MIAARQGLPACVEGLLLIPLTADARRHAYQLGARGDGMQCERARAPGRARRRRRAPAAAALPPRPCVQAFVTTGGTTGTCTCRL